MATLRDVARLANVDVSTVSRAINNTSYVHPDTKAKVMRAVEELSYKPNLLAKGLRQGKRNTIGVVLPSVKLSIFAEITQSIEEQARRQGYACMICYTQDDPDKEQQCLTRLRNGLVDGIVIASTGQNSRLLRDIRSDGIALVQLIRKQDKTMSGVVADYQHCAYIGVSHLVERGCRHIGLINGDLDIIPYRERYKGYKKAIKDAMLEEYVTKAGVPKCDAFTDGYNGTKALLRHNQDIDGIVVAVDMQGIGALRALKEAGLKVPEQIKVVSLTGHSIGGLLETAMTSMEIPADEIGRAVTNMIIADIEAPLDAKPAVSHIVFQATLAVRETT